MTVEEALRELGVDAAAGREEVRRAYLRLIKTRKPESDPDGFQRARHAYEIAQAGVDLEAIAIDSEQRYAVATGPDLVPAAGPAPGGTSPNAAHAPVASETVFDGFVTAWRAVPRSADPRLRIEIAREAVAVLPADPRAHWLLVRSLSGTVNDAPLAEALRAGWKAGWPEFLEALLLRLPGRASRDEVAAAIASTRPGLRLAGAAVGALQGDGMGAAQVVIDICADVAQGRLSDVDGVPVRRMLDVILALHQAGTAAAAVRAHAALAACLHDSGTELALAAGPLGAVWTLAGELARLPEDFPSDLRRAFAAATRSGDLETAVIDATNQARDHRRLVAKWAGRIRASAPNIASALNAALARAKARRVSLPRLSLRMWWLLVPFCSALARMCDGSSVPQRATQYIVEPRGPATSSQGPDRGPVDKAALEMAEDAATELCGAAGPRHGQLVCGTIDGLLAAIVESDCAAATDQLEEIERVLGIKPAKKLDARVVTRLHLVAWQACGEKPPFLLPEQTK